jgi:hypothetical protein
MKYMMFIKHAEKREPLQVPQALMDAMDGFVSRSMAEGVVKDTAGLTPTAAGYRIRSSGGKLKTTDGPFTEAKEVIGGYALIETPSADRARELAYEFMELHRVHWPEFECECEVRPLDGQ